MYLIHEFYVINVEKLRRFTNTENCVVITMTIASIDQSSSSENFDANNNEVNS